MAVGVAPAGEPHNRLRQKAASTGSREALLEKWVKGLDCGDRQLGLAAPPQREAGVLRNSLVREAPAQAVQQFLPWGRPPGWPVRRTTLRMLDLYTAVVCGELPALIHHLTKHRDKSLFHPYRG